jgi:hypothetical protein
VLQLLRTNGMQVTPYAPHDCCSHVALRSFCYHHALLHLLRAFTCSNMLTTGCQPCRDKFMSEFRAPDVRVALEVRAERGGDGISHI